MSQDIVVQVIFDSVSDQWFAIMTLVTPGEISDHIKECSEMVSVTVSAVESRSKLKEQLDSDTEETISSLIIGRYGSCDGLVGDESGRETDEEASWLAVDVY